MKRRFMKLASSLLSISMVLMLLPSHVLADDEEEINLVQVGSTLDFEDGELVGTVAGAADATGPGSISVATYDANRVLRVHSPLSGGSSFWWTLPLDSGDYDITGHDVVEVTLDWWVEITRPNANSLDVRLNDGDTRVVTLRSRGAGTSESAPASVSYYVGNAGDSNEPAVGSAINALTGLPRLTKLTATITVDLLYKEATIHVTDGDARTHTSARLSISSNQLTSLSIGASRASGNNWARFNDDPNVEWDEDSYGLRVDNIVIRAAATDREPPAILPSSIQITPARADLEAGVNAMAGRRSVTFSANVQPLNADDRSVTWVIGDPDIASIEVNGDGTVKVTGVAEGDTVLTAIANARNDVTASVPISVKHIGAFDEPTPDFSDLLADGYTLKAGTNFANGGVNPLWIFTGGTYHSHYREDTPQPNFYFRFDASGSGNRGGQGNLPEPIFGSKVFVHFDWKVPAVSTQQNTFNISFQDGANVLLSLRTGTYNGNRTIGAFSGPLPGPTGSDPSFFWSSDRYHEFAYNTVEIWYTVEIEFDFDQMIATASIVPRDGATAVPSTVQVPFDGVQISSVVLTGERASQNNINVTDNGIDNLYFFAKPLSDTTITEVLPYDFLPKRPATADDNTWQSWTKVVYIGDVTDEADLGLPETIQVRVASGDVATVEVDWELAEVPWSKEVAPLVYDSTKQGVFGYVGTIRDKPDEAVNRMRVKPKLYIENRHKTPLTHQPLSMEWLDRGVVAVPVKDGEGVLVTWRLRATEYGKNVQFNVYRNNLRINPEPVTTLNFIDTRGQAGDTYIVEALPSGERSKPAVAWATNYIDIPLQRPKDRPNPALAYGANEADGNANPISYTANDISVADVNGDGQYEFVVKWYPSEAQDPGLSNRHTGETIFDAYTLDGKLLWRINLGINIVSSAHHSAFNFYDLDQDGKAEFMVKTADGTRVYLPKEDGTIDDLTDTPAWVIGDPNAVWVGGLRNPANDNQINNTALGRVASGPEYITVFNGETGEPIDTVDYFAPYNINPNWGDNNNNRSDRFNGAVAYMPKGGVAGEKPYPTVIEVRGHYGPHFVAAYQLIDGKIKKIWEFRLAEWNAGNNQGNHNLQVADLDFDGYYEVVLGGLALDQDGSVLWSTNGTRGTVAAGHGDALHVSVMVPGSDEFYVFQPHESGPPNNVTLVRGSNGQPVWTYAANIGDVGRGVAANVTPLPGYEVWASATPMYNIVTGEVITTDVGGIGMMNKAPVNFILYWDGDLLSEFFDGPDNLNVTDPPVVTKFVYDVETRDSELITLQTLTGTYSNNGTKANPGLIADIFGDWREEILVRTADNEALRIYTTDIPTDHVIYTLMHDPVYRLSANSQNAMYNQPTHIGFYLGEDVKDQVQAMQLPVANIYYTNKPEQGGQPGGSPGSDSPGSGSPSSPQTPSDPGPADDEDADEPTTGPEDEPSAEEKPQFKDTIVADAEQFRSTVQQKLDDNPPLEFPDVPEDHWAARAIAYATQLGIINGTPSGEFKGNDKVTRAQFAVMIARAFGIDATGVTNSFSDTEGHWAAAYINALHQLGIVNGVGNGEFQPDREITRAEMAVILTRVLSLSAANGGATFTDIAGHWAEQEISLLAQTGIVSGVGDGRYAPNDTATRQESVMMIMRMLNTVLDLGLDL